MISVRLYLIGTKDLKFSDPHYQIRGIGIYLQIVKVFGIIVFVHTFEMPQDAAEQLFRKIRKDIIPIE